MLDVTFLETPDSNTVSFLVNTIYFVIANSILYIEEPFICSIVFKSSLYIILI